ncbi:MAG: DNA polymerase IV [Methanomicrobiales archaeon]|nr:DNA polymerase IV [Methanomicrobiales archaeon]
MNIPRVIFHVDMNSFYASIEVRENPALQGLPVIVGSDPKGGTGRGVVCTCSYEARQYGVHSAMPIGMAYQHCPSAVFLPPRHTLYAEVSHRVMQVLRGYATQFEQVSIDEAYLDVSSWCDYQSAPLIARAIKTELLDQEGLTCSIGVGPTKVVAKIASDFKKPDGLTVVYPEKVRAFLDPLPVRALPGIGKKTGLVLAEAGISTIGDLAAADPQDLMARLGRSAASLQALARGEDESPVRETGSVKSVSRETTFEKEIDDYFSLHEALGAIAAELAGDLTAERFLFRTLTLKIRYADFTTHTRQTSVRPPRGGGEIQNLAKGLLAEFPAGKAVRLLGVRLSNLSGGRARQATLTEF